VSLVSLSACKTGRIRHQVYLVEERWFRIRLKAKRYNLYFTPTCDI